ncbi:MAG: T9SS type A sorting domain-containing protein [Bacteroidales bacterium]|nr:T9SS type A sorting domain-containing protein [Bacteroidales bacterium]
MRTLYILTIISILVCSSTSSYTQEIEVKNNYFFIDGEKFFVKGIGFEVGALPGELPWEHSFKPEQLHFDIQRILGAGFNTIRTWAAFSEQELELLDAYDIKIIMGIWIDPHADFGDEYVVSEAKAKVNNVLSYSKNYNNIIAYLIMNEPRPETIFNAGYTETVSLWNELIDIIHAQHPGRPVSIANTSNGTYIDPAIFDFNAYNVYIYNPVTVNFLHGYQNFTRYLRQISTSGQPLVITEYGLSVSPSGPGNWGYGGNSLTEQKEGVLHMYSSLVNGGASGSCVFNYSDGWWKGGNEFEHNDNPEEWFGLIEYTDLEDTVGQKRPAWDAVKAYQSAIITEPKSSEIYSTKVPVEIFADDTIHHIEIMADNELIMQLQAENDHITDTLNIDVEDIKDIKLQSNCYDDENTLIKREDKIILVSKDTLELPGIDISLNQGFWQTGDLEVDYTIHKSANFTTDAMLDYIYYPHIGFQYGQSFQTTMPPGNPTHFSAQHAIDQETDVFTVGAAFDIHYNDFQKRVYAQVTQSKIDSAYGFNDHFKESTVLLKPNPATDKFLLSVSAKAPISGSGFNYTIFDSRGCCVKQGERTGWNRPINIESLSPGVYLVRITIDETSILTEKLVRL